MKDYIGVRAITGSVMTRGDYNTHRGWTIPSDEDPSDLGYLVISFGGHESWLPKEQFEAAYLEIAEPTKISPEDVSRFIGSYDKAFTFSQLDPKTTHGRLCTRSGFVQHAFSSCVDPRNYDAKIGEEMCVKQLNDNMWPMLGFVLQWANYGLTPLDK